MMQARFLGFVSGFGWQRNSMTLGGSVVLDSKRLVTGILAVGILLFLMALSATPAWAQTLTVDKTDSPDPVTEGQILNYSIEVTNTGEAPATNVILTDDLPPETAFVSVSTTAGTCTTPDEGDSGTVTCNLGNIAAGASATVAIEVRATQAGSVQNTATATSDDSTVTDTDTTSTRVLPDLVIDKLDDPDPVSGVEQLLLYTIRIQNQGNSPVSNVAVTDDLPLSQVDFVTLDSNDFDCQITAGLVQCNLIGDLGVGEVARVEIVVEPEVAGTIQNGAAVFFGQTRIDTAVEETTVQESAVADEPDPGEDPGTDPGEDPGADPGEDPGEFGNGDDQYDEDDVINVPNTDLPNTGGFPPLLAVGFFLVAGAGLGTALLRRGY